MNIIRRNELHRGGFAGLRETRLVMNPSVFGRHRAPGTSAGGTRASSTTSHV